MDNSKFTRPQHVFVLILVVWYVFLALGHYFDQRPLWNDEQCVLDNIFKAPSFLFTQPLVAAQAFPRLYLWLIQQFSKPFHQNLLALRFFPLLAMLAAFFVWIKITRRVLEGAGNLILFIGAWCACLPLVYHAAELKPYSMDVLICGVIVWVLINQDHFQKNPARYRTILLLLPFLGLWSYAALFLLLLPLYNLIRDSFDQRRWLAELSFYLTGYILMLGLVYFFDYRVSTPQLLVTCWHDNFISMHSMKDFLNSFGKGINNLIGRRFAEIPRWVKVPSRFFIGLGVVYMLAVFWSQFKKDRFALRSVVTISLMMLFLQLVLAMAWVFPFAIPRMSLFFSPLLLLMTIMAMDYIYQQHKVLGLVLRVIFSGYLIFVSLGIAWDVFLKGDLGAQSTLYSGMIRV